MMMPAPQAWRQPRPNRPLHFQQDSISARPLLRTHASQYSPIAPAPTPVQRPVSQVSQDNMLRRKTPSGTIAAGYDAAPAEWSTRPTKHILLPVQQEGTLPGNTQIQFLRNVQPESNSPVSGSGAWDRLGQNMVGGMNLQNLGLGLGNVSQAPSSWSYTPVDANVGPDIRHFVGQQQYMAPTTADARFFTGQPYGFQPLYNPIAPPTASCDDSDGYQFGGVNYENTPRNANWGQHGHWDNNAVGSAQFGGQNALHSYTPQLQNTNIWSPQPYTPSELGFGSTHPSSQHSRTPLYNISQPQQETRNTAPQIDSSTDAFPVVNSPDTYHPHYRERVLLYAHKAYVELLASVQAQQREADAQSGHRSKSGQHSKTGLFPRPPQPPACDWQNINFRSHKAVRELDPQKAMPDMSGHGNSYPGIGTSSSHAMGSSGYALVNANQRNMHGAIGGTAPKQSVDCYSLLQQVASNMAGERSHGASSHGASSRINMAVPIAPNMNSSQVAIATQAMTALDLLDGLCNENQEPWVDGLLLGGCLAFGLGDLNRALGWYYRVLGVDQNHVEALSNLGATLLSLNRQEEAEQYWRRAVKIRPSYFEAVEHLIGLLCGSQRSREAADLINSIEHSLRRPGYYSEQQPSLTNSASGEGSLLSTGSGSSGASFDFESADFHVHNYDIPGNLVFGHGNPYMIPGSENGRMLALIHAKGNMLYTLGDNIGAAKAFEDAVLVASGIQKGGIRSLIDRILIVLSAAVYNIGSAELGGKAPQMPVLLTPDKAVQTARLVFPPIGHLPGLREVPQGSALKAAISTTSNSLLSLAKIFQDGMSSGAGAGGNGKSAAGVKEILALYYLSLSLHPSPSTANNVGILLASIPHSASITLAPTSTSTWRTGLGSGIGLALSYYYYGLNLDSRHAHLYTNLGSLLKDLNNLPAAIQMYEKAVQCDDSFDIALANLANAVKDQGRINDAINYYRRAVRANPEFAEAVCGLANARNSVCCWIGRGGVVRDGGNRDRWHVDDNGVLIDARGLGVTSSGWMKRVVDIVEKQLREGESWGKGVLVGAYFERFLASIEAADGGGWSEERRQALRLVLQSWSRKPFEGAKIIRMVERASRRIGWRWYQDRLRGNHKSDNSYLRPLVPASLTTPSAPTVLPFHTFTCPLSAKQVRRISERNGLRISCSTLRAPWLPPTVYPPPAPPAPYLRVGYVSSDFNNHPLAHLMQSVFGLHDRQRVKAYCYATTASDNSEHRKQIERETPVFIDASSWGSDRLVKQIVDDGIHILINLNGFTRGARNEVFAARPAPIQMSFMGFAGTLGAEWCDYLYADTTAVPPETLRPWRRNVDIDDEIQEVSPEAEEKWIYAENIIFARHTFFCCDHRQSAPDAKAPRLNWEQETKRRWEMRKQIFPDLPHDTIILANFNQLYKIEPTTFRTWLRILNQVPKAILWLLRFPDLGEANLLDLAEKWAGSEVRSRIRFTDVAPKAMHISRAQVCDIFLDTPECNAHTTAADVLWSGTPLLTYPRHKYKMCSRIAASILRAAAPQTPEGRKMAEGLIASSEQEYETRAVQLANDMVYDNDKGRGRGELFNIRKVLFESRWTNELFNTWRWVRDLEDAYEEAWRRWTRGEGDDIYLDQIKKSY